MITPEPTTVAGRLFHRPVATGPAYWGPGDHYTFLVTGEESGGAYFVMEALVPAGGGPPPPTPPPAEGGHPTSPGPGQGLPWQGLGGARPPHGRPLPLPHALLFRPP